MTAFKEMDLQHRIRLIAGLNILGSLLLARVWSRWWLGFTAFVGVNLIQSAFTRWCLMEEFLVKRGWSGPAPQPRAPDAAPGKN